MAYPSPDLSLLGLAVAQDRRGDPEQPVEVQDGIHLRWGFPVSRGFPWYGFYLFRRRSPWAGEGVSWRGPWADSPVLGQSLRTSFGVFTSPQRLLLSASTSGRLGLELRDRQELRFDVDAPEVMGKLELEFETAKDFAGVITVAGFLGNLEVEQRTLAADPNTTVRLTLTCPTLTAVTIRPAAALLMELRCVQRAQGANLGWEPLHGLDYPICLPVAVGTCPCPGKPVSPEDARDLIVARLQRLRYPLPGGLSVDKVIASLAELVGTGPPSSMATVMRPGPSFPIGIAGIDVPLLSTVLLASLHPAVACALGLYFLDHELDGKSSYDYLLLADRGTPTGPELGGVGRALAWIAAHPSAFQLVTPGQDPFPAVDREILFEKRQIADPRPPPPDRASIHTLPAAPRSRSLAAPTTPSGSAGLSWQVAAGPQQPETPVLFHVRRAELGDGEAPVPVPSNLAAWRLLSRDKPIALATPAPEPSDPVAAPRPNWPRDLRFLDLDLGDGWYSYRVTGIDLFGRFSDASEIGPWQLRDALAPPSPTIEASVIDGADPWMESYQQAVDLRDDPATLGLRVSWLWTVEQRVQAPDTSEFRIYWQPGRLNARVGRVTASVQDAAGEGEVVTDINDALGVDAWVEATFWCENKPFEVMSSVGGPGLRIRVRSRGEAPTALPSPGRPCSLIAPERHPLYVDYRRPAEWKARLIVRSVAERTGIRFLRARDPAGTELEGSNARLAGGLVELGVSHERLALLSPWHDHVRFPGAAGLPEAGFPIARVHEAGGVVEVASAGVAAGQELAWEIVRPAWEYDIIIPAPDAGVGEAFAVDASNPVAYGQVAVTAADDKRYVADDLRRAVEPWGGRFGNESAIAGPATVFRVLREIPEPPEPWDGLDSLQSSPPDYFGRSSFSVRWTFRPGYKVHVLRALDSAVFAVDRHRQVVGRLEEILTEEQKKRMPAGWKSVAPDLEAFYARLAPGAPRSDKEYTSLTARALRVLASLPGNDRAFTQLTVEPVDQEDPTRHDRVGPDDNTGYVPTPGLRVWLDTTLPGRATNRYFYRVVFVDGAHNRSVPSVPGPPVSLWGPPPQAPSVTRMSGRDGAIELSWAKAAVGESQHGATWIYRSDSREATEDVRRMVLVAELGEGVTRWVDGPPERPRLPPGTNFYYRLVTVGPNGDLSEPSRIATARAFDNSLPSEPVWLAPEVGPTSSSVVLKWTGADSTSSLLVERKSGTGRWLPASTWLDPGVNSFTDTNREPGRYYDYRLRLRDGKGRQCIGALLAAV